MTIRIYLAGAIGCYGEGAIYPKAWRRTVTQYFNDCIKYIYDYKFTCIDPTDYYEYGKNYHKSEKEIMLFDLRKVKSSKVVLVNLKDIEKSPGTIDEILYAWICNIPIIGFLETENDEEDDINLHPWIKEQIDRIETGRDAMKKAMHYIRDYYGETR